MRIREPGGLLLAKIRRRENRLYVLHLNIAHAGCLSLRGEEEAWRWHARLGHINMAALRRMAREELVRGLPSIGDVGRLCDACQAGKQRRTPFPSEAQFRAKRALELVHGDLCGPVTPATPSGNNYFLLLVDDYSRYMWLAAIPSKDRAAAAIRSIQAQAEGEGSVKLRVLRTDRGREFTSAEFAAYCAEDGVKRHLTAPYCPQQNGVVERRNGIVVAAARSLLKAKHLPCWFWGEAVNTAVYLLNRAPTRSVQGKTPFEAWYGKKSAVHHLRIFGCISYVRNTKPHLKKLDDRGRKMIFIGYERGTKAYRAYDPVTRQVHVTRDIMFDEQAEWDWSANEQSNGVQGSTGEEFTVHWEADVRALPEEEEIEEQGSPKLQSPPAAHGDQQQGERSPPSLEEGNDQDVDKLAAELDDNLDADHEADAPLRLRAMSDIVGPGAPPGLAVRQVGNQRLLFANAEEPSSLAEAEQQPSWRRVMEEELKAIEENGTWTLTELPQGRRGIGLRWVFKVKKDEHGAVTRHKARLVVKGYAQRRGVDYDEVFAPVARKETVRLLIALAASEGWQVHHMDVKSAFLNGDLQEEVFVHQPPGFELHGEEHKVYRLHKALYGLHQAPRAWNQKLDTTLLTMGFMRCPSDHAIYCKGKGKQRLVVVVYVDDLVITGSSSNLITEFKKQMAVMFKMSDLGLLSYYLGIEVRQSSDGIALSQSNYARKILEKGRMLGCNPCQVPMEARLKLSKVSENQCVDATEYRSLVGSLRYLVHTRPDLAFSVGYVSRFMEEPHTEHMAAVKHILRYIAGTCNLGLWYARRKEQELALIGFSDSDLAGDVDGRKSTSGVIFFLNDSPISWQSMKQRVVALSSCEAEYIAAATAACQGVWLARLLEEVLDSEVARLEIRIDNKSAISLIRNPVFHDRSKHIDVRYHFIRDCAQEGLIEVNFVSTEEQLGDVLTKALIKIKFEELCAKIGLRKGE